MIKSGIVPTYSEIIELQEDHPCLVRRTPPQIKSFVANETKKLGRNDDKSILHKRKNDTENSSKDHFSNESDEQNEGIVSAKISGRTEPREMSNVQFVDEGIYHICSKKSVKDTGDGIIAKWGPRTFYKTCVIKSSNNQNELKQIKAILENSSTLKVSLQKDKSMLQKRKNDTENSSKDHLSEESNEQNEGIVSAKISGRTEPREMSNVVSGCSSTNVRGTEDDIDTLLRSGKISEHTDAEISGSMFSSVQFVDDGIYHICSKKSVKDTGDGIIAKWGPRTFYKTCVIKSSNNKNELKQIKAILENSSTLKVSLQKDKSMLQKRKNNTENSSKDHFSNESDEQNEGIVSATISGRTEPREMSNDRFDAAITAIDALADLDKTKQEYKSPSTAFEMGSQLKKFREHLITMCIESKDKNRKTEVQDFLKISEEELAVCINRTNIAGFNNYLNKKRQLFHKKLEAAFDYNYWKELASLTLISIQTFNRRRAAKVERMRVADFKNYQSMSSNNDPELLDKLSEGFELKGKNMSVSKYEERNPQELQS
ncbi:hypothetical protein JTB14_011638 [Gonioctena quinquepunctata]|nr:hypothetical protein JTB14_011638 [Gonioctena quinquepunctata]